MNLHPKTYGKVLVLTPVGRIDHATAEAFQEAFLPYVNNCAGDHSMIVLDLSGVEYMSSAGLRVLMLAAKRCQKLSGTVVMAGMQPPMREIFEISRFHLLFAVYDQVRDALAALSSDALAAFEGR